MDVEDNATEKDVTPKTNYSGKAKQETSEPLAEREKLAPIVTGGAVKQRKKSLGKKIAETFTGDDAKNVVRFVFLDVAVPAAKNMLSDMVSEGIERFLFGESSGRRSRSVSPTRIGNYTPYNRIVESKPEPRRELSRRAKATHDFGEIIIPNRAEAEAVIERLVDTIEQYGTATVADLLDLLDLNTNFTDNKWGWTEPRGMGIDRARDGFLLVLPQPVPID